MRVVQTATVAIVVAGLVTLGLACVSGDSAPCGTTAGGLSPDAAAVGDAGTGDAVDGAKGVEAGEGGGALADAGTDSSPMLEAQAPVDAAAPEATSFTVAFVRLANWSPDSPAVDFCLAPHGTGAFIGPLAASFASSVDAGAIPLTQPLVTAYFPIAPGTYDARIVVAGAGTCTVGIGADMTSLPALGAGEFATIALIGEALPAGADPGLELVGFKDSTSVPSGVGLRFINASPALNLVDFGTGTISSFKPLFVGVQFGQAGKPVSAPLCGASTADGGPSEAGTPADSGGHASDGSAPSTPQMNGYQTNCKLSNTTLSAHDPRTLMDAVVTPSPVNAAAGSVLTVVMIGGTSGGAAPKLLECVDNAGTAGELGNCCGLGFSVGPAATPMLPACPQ